MKKIKLAALICLVFSTTVFSQVKQEASRRTHAFSLPIGRILYDADSNVIAMTLTTKGGKINVLLNEPKILELSKKKIDSLKISGEEYLKSVRGFIAGEYNPKRGFWEHCWICNTTLCHNPNHLPGCGWEECYWGLCPPGEHPFSLLIDSDKKVLAKTEKNEASVRPHAFNLPAEKIIYDADGNALGMAIKTKDGGLNILLDEGKILESSKQQIDSLKISKEEYMKTLRRHLTGGEVNPKAGGTTPLCWVAVYCHNPNHPIGCGWMELRPCGGWNLDRPR